MNDINRPRTGTFSKAATSSNDKETDMKIDIFEYIFQKVPVSMYILSEEKLIYVNDHLCQLLHYTEDDFLTGRVMLKHIVHQEDLPSVRQRISNSSDTGSKNARYRARMLKSDGSFLHAEIHSTLSELDGKRVFIGSVSDITEEVFAQHRLKESEERYNSLFFENPDAIFTFDMEGNFIDVNPGAVVMSGYSYEEILEMSFMPMIVPEQLDHTMYYFNESLKGNSNVYRVDIYDKNGELLYLEVTSFPMQQAGKITGVYGIAKDITKRIEHEKLLEDMAFFDHLTKLPNRKLFEDRLEQALKISNNADTAPAVLFLNIDRFKYINDSLGYEYGDIFLKQAAERMVESVSESATVGRFAGDEFAVLLPDSSADTAVTSAQRLNELLAEPMEVMGQELSMTVSIGIARGNATQKELLRQAEAAMLYTKKYCKNSYSVFSSELNKETVDKLTIERELKSAIDNNEFLLHYQPIMDLKTGKLSAMEALIRWNHTEMGMVPPDRFIPVSEENGQIIAIGKWVLHTACMQSKSWQNQGYPPFRICVNISTIQLQHPNFVYLVKSILTETGLDAKWLELEVTESTLLEDTESLKESLRKLKALGISMSIDDFGTGFTSLNYLRKFSFDRVKIDRSFVQDINNDLNGKTITSTIINLAHKLGMEVVAEGIEDTVQLAYLEEEMCNEGQGYYFCRPQAAGQHDFLLMSKK